jgi:GT2 family glycosyltransferase
MATKLSIIIVNYKSWEVLRQNLKALVSFQFPDFELEIIVVDNYSNDGKLPGFLAKFPKVKFMENSGNNGFAHGCNFGAEKSTGDLLLFLNPDTLATAESISAMEKAYQTDSEAGIVSCIQSEKPSSYQKILPSFWTLFGIQRSIYKMIFSKKISETNCKTCDCQAVNPEWISGSVVMISRENFERSGKWNTDYWMYSEDVELSLRVRQLGQKLIMLCDFPIKHEHGGASRRNIRTAALTKTEVIISQHVYINNNFKGVEKILSHTVMVLNNLIFKSLLPFLGLILFFLPKGRLQILLAKNLYGYYLNALFHGTWMSPRAVRK